LNGSTENLSYANLGTLQIAQNGDQCVLFLRDPPHALDAGSVPGMVTVRKMQARHTHPRVNDCADHVIRIGRGAKRTHDASALFHE
jgi:hypothetical protein